MNIPPFTSGGNPSVRRHTRKAGTAAPADPARRSGDLPRRLSAAVRVSTVIPLVRLAASNADTGSASAAHEQAVRRRMLNDDGPRRDLRAAATRSTDGRAREPDSAAARQVTSDQVRAEDVFRLGAIGSTRPTSGGRASVSSVPTASALGMANLPILRGGPFRL